MAVIETWLRQDLKGLVTVRSLQGQVFSLDNGGNLIGVKVTKDGQPVTLTGTVTGYCILSDGQTVTVTGSGKSGIQNGNEAYIVLPQLVYSVPGQISIVIKLTSGSVTTTLAACTGYVYRSRTSNEVVPPGTPIPDLATLEEAISRANAATNSANTAASSANNAATAAENVNVAMSKSGKVITITATNRSGTSTSHTVTEPTLTVERANNVVTVTATDADGRTSIEFDAVDADEVAELQEAVSTKAEEDGYYEELAAGTADQLVSTEAVTDTTPYLYRKSGGSVDIGNRATLDKIVGGTVGWNQLFPFEEDTYETNGVKFSIENGKVTCSGTFSTSSSFSIFPARVYNQLKLIKDHVYFLYVSGTWNFGMSYKTYGGPPQQINLESKTPKIFKANSATITDSEFVIVAPQGTEATGTFYSYMCDLTAMFDPTIADYIYNLEQANAGDGVAWFRKLFPKEYYPYNPGELISVKPTSHDMVGFNLWDEEWEKGDLDLTTGAPTASNSSIRSKNFVPVLPNTSYYFKGTSNTGLWTMFYDSDKNVISEGLPSGAQSASNARKLKNIECTMPANCRYIKFYLETAYGTTYQNDICINLSHSGSRNGEYEPYEKHSYPLADVELRGPLAIDADGKLVYSGDEYTPDGLVTRKYKLANLGTATWSYNSTDGIFYSGDISNFVKDVRLAEKANVICPKYETVAGMGYNGGKDKSISIGYMYRAKDINIKDSAYTDANTFKASLANVWLLYELATPTTEEADPYTSIQVVDDWGTEEFVDTREVAIPVGHSTSYMANLRDKLQHLPSLAEDDGEYIVKQIGSQMSLAPFKAGTYPDMHVGVADQLLSKQSIEDQVPYGFRQSGGGLAIGDREEDTIVGGTVAWNQLIRELNANNYGSEAGVTATFENNIATISSTTANNGILCHKKVPVTNGHKYMLAFDVKASTGLISAISMIPASAKINCDYAVQSSNWESVSRILLAESTSELSLYIFVRYAAQYENVQFKNVQLFDLTAMFGPTIADYIYNLEQATAGAGVAWFRKLFPKDYYEYNPGELKSVEAVNAHEMVGFNLYPDIDFTNGSINTVNGSIESHSSRVTTNAFMTIDPSMQYYCHANAETYLFFYDKDHNYIGFNGNSQANKTFIPQNLANNVAGLTRNFSEAKYMRARYDIPSYDGDFCISLSSSRNGEYEPYHKSSYPLDSSLTLRGIPKLDANNKLYYDGDTYAGDGTVTRRYGVVDLGTLSMRLHDENIFQIEIPGIKKQSDDDGYIGRQQGVFCSKYVADSQFSISSAMTDKTWLRAIGNLYVKDTLYTNVEAFKVAMSGVMLVYELSEPTTEQAEPYQSVQQVDPYGTEEYTHSGDADVYVPVGHVTKYPSDLRSKIENAPDAPSGNGDYIVRKTAEGVSYVSLTQAKEIPAPPSANGTYRLTVTVANGTPTYSWVSA